MKATCDHCGKAYTIPAKSGWRLILAHVLTAGIFGWFLCVMVLATLGLFGVIEL